MRYLSVSICNGMIVMEKLCYLVLLMTLETPNFFDGFPYNWKGVCGEDPPF